MGGRIIRGGTAKEGGLARQTIRGLRSIYLALFLLFCPPLFCPLYAADSSLLSIQHVDVGFDGVYRSGFWTPITLTLLANDSPVSGELQIISSDGENVPVVFFAGADGQESSRRIQLEAGKEVVFRSYLKVGPQKSSLSARLIDSATQRILWQGRLPKSLPAPRSATTPLVVTLGSPVGVEDALKFTRRSEANAIVSAVVDTPAAMPNHWWGYEGVEIIFLPTGLRPPKSPGVLGELSREQSDAILQWVQQGGRLVLSAGSQAPVLLDKDSLWKDLIPGELVELVPMRDSTTLESLTGEAFPFTDDASRPLVARLTPSRGKIELSQGPRAADVPLVIRARHGFGEVTLVAFDLEGERFATWAGRPRFVAGLMRESKNPQEQPGEGAGKKLGYTDLSGQLRAALDQFPGVRVINFTTVAILIITYIVLIGPLDFLLLKRLGVSRSLTWFTFPLLAVLFCGIAWFSARWSHGELLWLNQAEIIDIDAERGHLRGTTWFHLYSPATKTYDVSLHPEAAVVAKPGTTAGHVAWQGLPGRGLGGLDAEQAASSALNPYEIDPYEIGFPVANPELHALPIRVGSSKSLAARWWQDVSFSKNSRMTLSEHGVPSGDIVNPLDVELQDCIFTFNIWMYRIKKFGPGERFNLSDARPLYLESRLQRHTANDFKDSATPWQRDSSDVPEILQMLMYHEAAKGQSYTGLTHQYQAHLDLSAQLTSNSRGLLVGRVRKPATEIRIDGSPLAAEQIQSWTYYRIVIPVGERGASAP